nr:immunoglobulin light chain junction region [Macaca mulatta]MOX79891.1 immunoglobulin light chain junction region [Macaca mulatta]MOX81247.1 immunoglobulin light chain junction region [Macaca mulatta]MOX81915.1 immunoglobulin light chain junction region [Macaca mulatta]MOX83656.1 immunoglobulin light chain junction region [Macaca mulatta]
DYYCHVYDSSHIF